MEEPAGLEPANSSFAGCGLTNLAMVPLNKRWWYPEPDLNRHGRNDRGILSPLCLPFHHPGFIGHHYYFISFFYGAGERDRTVDPNLGKVMLYR